MRFRHKESTIAFFGTCFEVAPYSRLVWTNEEGDEGQIIITVTFEEHAGRTTMIVHDLYPAEAALDAGAAGALPESLDQLDELLASLA